MTSTFGFAEEKSDRGGGGCKDDGTMDEFTNSDGLMYAFFLLKLALRTRCLNFSRFLER